MKFCDHIEHFIYTKITTDRPSYLLAYCHLCEKHFKLVRVIPVRAKGKGMRKYIIGFKEKK